jgi:hypothetical protein
MDGRSMIQGLNLVENILESNHLDDQDRIHAILNGP